MRYYGAARMCLWLRGRVRDRWQEPVYGSVFNEYLLVIVIC